LRLSDYKNIGETYPQYLTWRAPYKLSKWKGLAEVVISTNWSGKLQTFNIDTRVRRTSEHPKGISFTKEGIRLTVEQAISYHKALGKTIEAVLGEIKAREKAEGELEDVTG
jgi:hypothetical protein